MSLARAFTKRTRRPEVAPLPTREGSVRYTPGTINRDKISLPTELISTTNMHALNAPDIRSVSTSSSNSSLHSNELSDFSHIDTSFIDSPMTSPETSSIESSPTSTQPSSFFDTKGPQRSMTSGTIRSTPSMSSMSSADTPALPQRALSHSKHAHQEVVRKKSISRLSPPPSSIPSANAVRDSSAFFNGSMDQAHPFGHELAQVDEVAEEFGGVKSNMDEEEQLLASKGLFKFTVEDYLTEIEDLFGGYYGARAANNMWI